MLVKRLKKPIFCWEMQRSKEKLDRNSDLIPISAFNIYGLFLGKQTKVHFMMIALQRCL